MNEVQTGITTQPSDLAMADLEQHRNDYNA